MSKKSFEQIRNEQVASAIRDLAGKFKYRAGAYSNEKLRKLQKSLNERIAVLSKDALKARLEKEIEELKTEIETKVKKFKSDAEVLEKQFQLHGATAAVIKASEKMVFRLEELGLDDSEY